MATQKSAAFRQADVTRAIKAAKNADLTVSGLEFAPDGSFRLVIAEAGGEGVEMAADEAFADWQRKKRRAS